MRTSVSGTISHITPGAVSSEVTITLGDGVEVVSILTRRSVEALGLTVGLPATALIKASFVILALGENLKTSARNHMPGVVTHREDGAVNSEVTPTSAPARA